jgi:hypothetical protein
MNGEFNRVEKRTHHMTKNLAHVVGPISYPMGNAANFTSTRASWPKTDYKKDPHVISRWGTEETRNTQYRYAHCEDRRGAAAGVAPGCPLDSIDTISFITMMKREYFTP